MIDPAPVGCWGARVGDERGVHIYTPRLGARLFLGGHGGDAV